MTPAASTSPAIALVQSLYEAFGRGDVAYITERVAPDCRWVCPGEGIPYAGSFTGPQGAATFFQKLAATEDFQRFEPREFFANGDDVVVLGFEECRSRLTGKTVSNNWAHIFRTRAGQVVAWEGFYDTGAFLRAHQA